MALGDHRGDDVAATLIEMGEPTADFDRVGYTREIATLVARNLELTAAEVQAGRVLFDVIDLSFRSGLRLPAEMTLLAKALFNLDGVTRALEPTLHAARHHPRVRQPDRDGARAARHVAAAASTRSRWRAATCSPRCRTGSTRSRSASRTTTSRRSVDVPQLPSLIVALQKVANRVFSGLVLAGLLVASAMLLPVLAHARHGRLRHRRGARAVHRADDHGERSGRAEGRVSQGVTCERRREQWLSRGVGTIHDQRTHSASRVHSCIPAPPWPTPSVTPSRAARRRSSSVSPGSPWRAAAAAPRRTATRRVVGRRRRGPGRSGRRCRDGPGGADGGCPAGREEHGVRHPHVSGRQDDGARGRPRPAHPTAGSATTSRALPQGRVVDRQAAAARRHGMGTRRRVRRPADVGTHAPSRSPRQHRRAGQVEASRATPT